MFFGRDCHKETPCKTESLLPEASSWGGQIKLASRRGTSVIVRGWWREKLRKVRRRLGRQAFEHGLGQVEFSSCGKSGKTKFTTSSRSRVISSSTKDSMASKVKQSFQAKSFILNASRPDNIAVVKRGKNVRLEIEKKERPKKKPRKTKTEIEAMGDLVINHVKVVRPGESVIHQNSQKPETLNLFHIHTINPQLQSTADLLPCQVYQHALSFQV